MSVHWLIYEPSANNINNINVQNLPVFFADISKKVPGGITMLGEEAELATDQCIDELEILPRLEESYYGDVTGVGWSDGVEGFVEHESRIFADSSGPASHELGGASDLLRNVEDFR